MSFSVAQEATADHAAMTYLDRSGQSARGLLKFFEILQADEPLNWRPDRPVGAHPSADQRAHRLSAPSCRDLAVIRTRRIRRAFVELLKRVQVKLHAFLDDPSATLRAYPESDQSPDARYARAIAYYRIPKLDKALPAIDGLIRDFPTNPYYRELKGQMLFENGRIREAIAPYEAAVKLAPEAALIRISLAQVYIESGDPALNKRAIAYLNDAARVEGRDGTLWRFLAIAYGRDNQFGMAALSLAEEALADGKKKDAQQQAQRAKQLATAEHGGLCARRGNPARGQGTRRRLIVLPPYETGHLLESAPHAPAVFCCSLFALASPRRRDGPGATRRPPSDFTPDQKASRSRRSSAIT
jgi:predicted Zn-dependent protease